MKIKIRNYGGLIQAARGLIYCTGSAIEGGLLEVTDNNYSRFVFLGDVTLEDLAWRDLGAGHFRIFPEARLFGDGVPEGQILVVRGGVGGASRLILTSQTLINNGTISVEWGGDVYVSEDAVLNGKGRLVLDDQPVTGAKGAVLTLGSRQTIEGWGKIEVPVRNLGRIENNRHILAFGQSLQSEGTIAAYDNAGISVAGLLQIDGQGRFGGRSLGTIRLGEGLMGNASDADGFPPQESIVFDDTITTPAVQSLEAMSADLGNVPDGYIGNFILESVVLSGSVSVKLADASDNAAGAGAEAVYVRTISVPADTTLDLNGLNLYARTIESGGTILGGQIVQTPDGGAIATGTATPGAIGQAGETDEWEFFGRAGRNVAVFVDPGSSSSSVPSPWLSYAEADRQVRLRFLNASREGLSFDLRGPDDWRGFSGQTEDSDLIALPSTGQYVLTVKPSAGLYDTDYAFRLEETTVLDLTLGLAYSGQFAGAGQATLFRIETTGNVPMKLTLTGASTNMRIELYARLGAPPTRGQYDYHFQDTAAASQEIVIPKAVTGTWYALLYYEHAVVGGGGNWIEITFNKLGQRIKSENQSGLVINYDYDKNAVLKGLQDEAGKDIVTYVHDAAGQPKEKTLGNGDQTTYDYNAAGGLENLVNKNSDGTIHSQFGIQVDETKNKASIQLPDSMKGIEYDPDGKPVLYVMDGNKWQIKKIELDYDENGDLDQVAKDGVVENYETDAKGNITQKGDTKYAYDADGNPIAEYGYPPPLGFSPVADEIDPSFPFSAAGEAGVRNNEEIEDDLFETDDGEEYSIYLAIDRGPYELWLEGTSGTSSFYRGDDDHMYSFYCVAIDGVGNRKVKSAASEASTLVSLRARAETWILY